MTNEWTGTMIIDEIDRLIVAYEKAKEYVTKITTGVEQQINIWQYRQQIVREQLVQTSSSSSYDFLLPKTQRINELTLEAVQTLCRTDLLIEQILRIDLKSRLTPVAQQSVPNNKLNGQTPVTLPVPVLRSQLPPPPPSTSDRIVPKPIENLSRPASIHDGSALTRQIYDPRTSSPFNLPIYQTKQPRPKEKISLQRIPAGTKWKQARIDIIDSLSGFYVGNLEQNVQETFLQMQDELNDHYSDLERSNQLIPLENLTIGDFGVAKFSEDDRWYRARLITREGNQQIKIVFIDFGNIEIKSLKEFFPIEKIFAELPAQAIACSLSQAYPPLQNETENIWSDETIEIFKHEVMNRTVEIHFEHQDDGPIKWPLHFVRILINNQSVTNLHSLQKRIDPRPNSFIAEQMTDSLSEQEYILFNVPPDNNIE